MKIIFFCLLTTMASKQKIKETITAENKLQDAAMAQQEKTQIRKSDINLAIVRRAPVILKGSGILKFPENGEKYENDQHFEWRIQANEEEHIELIFEKFDLESPCSFDYLIISDIKKTLDSYSVIEEHYYCGQEVPLVIKSKGNVVELTFRSDSSVTGEGFELWYQTLTELSPCNFVLKVENFSKPIHFPADGEYSNKEECSWHLWAPKGQFIVFVIISMDIQDSEDCVLDFLEFHDGHFSDSVSIGQRLCGSAGASPKSPLKIRSSGNSMFVVFNSDYSRAGKGFKAWYKLSEKPGTPLCPDFEVLLEGSGTLKFPKNDENYVNFMMCLWTINAKENKEISITFKMLDIEFEDQCSYDTLYIVENEDFDNPLHILCGDKPPPTLISKRSRISLIFISDQFLTNKGFEVEYAEVLDDEDHDCGRPLILRNVGRIIGGNVSIPYSWPWLVSIQEGAHMCGGAVLSEEWVITAGHCIFGMDISILTVVAGAHHRSSSVVGEKHRQIRKISEAFVYPKFDVVGSSPDAALVKLDEPLIFDYAKNGGSVHPICLPSETYKAPDKTICVVTGWGQTDDEAKFPFLNELDVPLIDDSICRAYYPTIFKDFEICAGFEKGGKDSCTGDSGSPLVCPSRGKYVLEGITSWGIGCAQPENPGVYTSVPKIVEWIKEKIKQL